MTQAELAQRIGGSTRAVEDWEAGRRQAPPMLRLALAAIRRDVLPWYPTAYDHRLADREEASLLVRTHFEETLADRAVTSWENWLSETSDLPLPEALLLGFLSMATDGYNDIKHTSEWKWLPTSGWQTSMVWHPNLGNGLHPTVAFECRHDEYAERLAVFVDSKRPNERLLGRLRVEQALLDDGFRVMTFSGDEILADAEGCVDRITSVISDLIDEVLIAAGKIQPRKKVAEIS